MIKAINRNKLKQNDLNSSATSPLLSSTRTHVSKLDTKSFPAQANKSIPTQQRRHPHARHPILSAHSAHQPTQQPNLNILLLLHSALFRRPHPLPPPQQNVHGLFPLAGEPGNFRTFKLRDTSTTTTNNTTLLKDNLNPDRSASAAAKEKSPPVAASPPPPIQTDIPIAGGGKKSANKEKGGERSPTTPGTGVREKPKRRKSRPVATPTEA